MTADREHARRLPPRWFVRIAWVLHRALYSLSSGRLGLWRPAAGTRFGTLRLATLGRRSGQPRVAILGYYEDGPNLVTLAMNGWAAPEPAWWLNLRANPDATVGQRAVGGAGLGRGQIYARPHKPWSPDGPSPSPHPRITIIRTRRQPHEHQADR
jgi:deazaflavin-dependent oxidoreductase (nitroreductase family)